MKASNVFINLGMLFINLLAVAAATWFISDQLKLDYNGHDLVLILALALVTIGSLTGVLTYHLTVKRSKK